MEAAPFFEAIRKADRGRIQALLQDEPSLVAARDSHGRSAVLLAVYYGQPELAETFAARIPALDVWEAAALGRTVRVAELVSADAGQANAVAPDGFTPAGLATFFGHPETLFYLLEHGADPDKPAENPTRVAPIHSAAAHSDDAVALRLTELLLDAGAAVNVAQQGGFTPLHQAAARGHAEMVRRLLAHGADPTAVDDDGKTPLDMAIANGHHDTAALPRTE